MYPTYPQLKYRAYLLLRQLLCSYNVHDYEALATTPEYADLYCFYCDHRKRSHIPK